MVVSVPLSAVLLRQRAGEHGAQAAVPRAIPHSARLRREPPRDGVARRESASVLYLLLAKLPTLKLFHKPLLVILVYSCCSISHQSVI